MTHTDTDNLNTVYARAAARKPSNNERVHTTERQQYRREYVHMQPCTCCPCTYDVSTLGSPRLARLRSAR